MIHLFTYYESLLGKLTGGILLSTLFGIGSVSNAQNKHKIEQKAKMSVLDSVKMLDVIHNLYKKGYEDYQKVDLKGDKFLFSSGTDINFSDALIRAKNDAELKIKYLGEIGNQYILRYTERNTNTVIIISEIL